MDPVFKPDPFSNRTRILLPTSERCGNEREPERYDCTKGHLGTIDSTYDVFKTDTSNTTNTTILKTVYDKIFEKIGTTYFHCNGKGSNGLDRVVYFYFKLFDIVDKSSTCAREYIALSSVGDNIVKGNNKFCCQYSAGKLPGNDEIGNEYCNLTLSEIQKPMASSITITTHLTVNQIGKGFNMALYCG